MIVKAQEHRTQERNRNAALERLRDVILSALHAPEPRKKTKVPKRAKKERLDDKRRRSKLKHMRKPVSED